MGDLIIVFVKSPSIPVQGVLGDYIDRCITIIILKVNAADMDVIPTSTVYTSNFDSPRISEYNFSAGVCCTV